MKSPSINSGSEFLPRFVFASLLGGISLSMAVGLLASSAWLISMASTQPPILTLQVAVVGVRFFGLGRGFFRYAERIYGHDAILRAATKIQIAIYKSLTKRPPISTSALRQGKLLQQLTSDVEVIQDRWIRLFIPGLSALISAWAGLGIIYWLIPQISLIVTLIYIITLLLVLMASAFVSHRKSADIFHDEANLADLIADTCRGHLEARMYGYQDTLKKDLANCENRLIRAEKRVIAGAGLSNSILLIGMYFSILVSFILGVNAFLEGELAGVNLAVVTLLPFAIFDGLSTFIPTLSTFGKIANANSNIDQVLNSENFHDGVATLEPGSAMVKLVSARGEWNERAVLHSPISFTVKAGETLVLQGESGIGKSTLALALAGLLDYQGSIRINGIEVRDIKRDYLVNALTVSLQDDYLFASSIRENLKIGKPEASDVEIENVLELVELQGMISKLPEGLNTFVGAFGKNFSGGELQRMRLARALLRKSALYIFDEPLEHIEDAQAERIWRRMREHLAESTVIVISHQNLAQDDGVERLTLKV